MKEAEVAWSCQQPSVQTPLGVDIRSGEHMKQCPSCGGNCGYSKSRGCQYGKGDDKPCKTHPSAPHGFLRNASHNAGRYVCECEHWEENT
jgi:hypothetical protein